MSDCCDNFGGRIIFEAGGERLKTRGDMTLDISDREVTAEANQDGSTYYPTKMMPVGGECEFTQSCNGSWFERMKKCSINITIIEADNNRQHTYTNTRFVGRPRYNLSTGAISGVTWAGGTYRTT